jgi:PAS domain S-box-containing protein
MRHERAGKVKRKQHAEWCACLFVCVAALSAGNAQAREVLLLHPLEQRAPEFAVIEAGLRREFASSAVDATHVYSELVDLDFRGPIDRRIFADYLRAKYADVGIDAVVALSDEAVQFVAAYRDVIGDVPLVFTTRASSTTGTIPNSSSVVAPLFPSRTVELALLLQPSAKHLFVVSDAPTADDVGLPPLRAFMREYSGKLDVEYLLGLAPDALLDRISRLPPDSFVLYAPLDRAPVPDGLAPHEMAEQLAARANAPVYGVHDDDVGRGFVGGYMPSSAEVGAELARQTLRALRGESSRAADIGGSYIVDSRALSRWNLDEARLPAGTELEFAPPSIWKLYQGWIITLLVLVAVQFALIVTLLIQSISRRRDRLALAETAHRFQLARVAGKVGIWQWDIGTQQLIVEPELRELLGYDASEGGEATGDWTKLIYEEDLPKFRRAARAHAQGVTASFELQHRALDKNGQVRWFLSRGQAIGRVRLIGTATDITERKRDEDERARTLLQLQEQRNELAHLGRAAMAGALSGAVAHELNQPLSAMMSNARAGLQFIAAGSADRQEIKDILADIENDGRRAGEVIRHLRSLLRRGEAQFETVHVDVIVDQVLRLINSDLISNNIKVVHEPMAGMPAISADAVQLQQVMLNLLSNACDALKGVNPRDRRITIGVGMRGPGRVRISVSDNGCGFGDGNSEHLFKPFVTTKRSGLGLGLSISRSIVEAHGGRIWAELNRDAGATFHVELGVAAQKTERVVA